MTLDALRSTLNAAWNHPPQKGWKSFLAVTLFAAAILLSIKGWFQFNDYGSYDYFVQLAWSFLHKRLDLDLPPAARDLSVFQGRVYMYWPPLNSLLMMPWVALRESPYLFPQRLYSIFFGSLNTGLYYLLLARASRTLNRSLSNGACLFGAVALGLGTSNFGFALWAHVWGLGQLTATTFYLLALWLGLRRSPMDSLSWPLLCGTAFALSFLGRLHLSLSLPFLIYLLVSDEQFALPGEGSLARRLWNTVFRRWKSLAAFLLPVALTVGALLWYNQARFGNSLETGVEFHNVAGPLLANFQKYGAFHWHFIPHNIYVLLLRVPGFQSFDRIWFNDGFSLFCQSPMLILAFAARTPRPYRDLSTFIWLGIGLITIPVFTFVNTGWVQFGARFLNDIVPLLALLAILKLPSYKPAVCFLLGMASIAINLNGALWGIDNAYWGMVLMDAALFAAGLGFLGYQRWRQGAEWRPKIYLYFALGIWGSLWVSFPGSAIWPLWNLGFLSGMCGLCVLILLDRFLADVGTEGFIRGLVLLLVLTTPSFCSLFTFPSINAFGILTSMVLLFLAYRLRHQWDQQKTVILVLLLGTLGLPWLFHKASANPDAPFAWQTHQVLKNPAASLLKPPGLTTGEWDTPYAAPEKGKSYLAYWLSSSIFGHFRFPLVRPAMIWLLFWLHVLIFGAAMKRIVSSGTAQLAGGAILAAWAAQILYAGGVEPFLNALDFRFIAWTWLPWSFLFAGALQDALADVQPRRRGITLSLVALCVGIQFFAIMTAIVR